MDADDFASLVTNGVTVALIVIGIAAVVSGLYIVWIYCQRTEDAPFLTRLVHRDVRVALAAFVIALYIVASLAGFGFPKPWGAVLIGFSIATALWGVIDDAWTWFWQRRKYGE